MFTTAGVQRAGNTVRDIRHDLLLNFSEDYLFQTSNDAFNNIYVELPYPIFNPNNNSNIDIIKQLLQEKHEYSNLLEVKRRRYNFDKKEIYKQKIADTEYLHIPKHLLEFYKISDPDFYFDCDYNFYYTGGFLEHIHLNNHDYLIRPNEENILCISNLQMPGSSFVLQHKVPNKVFNIRAVENCYDCLLVLRGKHNLNIVRFLDTEELNDIWFHNHNVPIFDAKLNHMQYQEIGFVDANLNLIIKNIETGKIVLNFENESKKDTDKFQQFQFIDRNTVALSDRFEVKFIDCRSKEVEQVVNPELLDCSSICNLEIKENQLFLASRHYLIKSDLRKFGNSSYYSHSLTAPPCYMSLGTNGDGDVLCLAGQTQDYSVLFSHKYDVSLPYKVPGIHDTLKACRLSNPSLVLHDVLDNRLNFSIAGMKIVNLNNENYIYTTNTLGDIFQQQISEVELDTKQAIESLSYWANKLNKVDPVLHLTSVEEMSGARFSMNTNTIEENLKKYKKFDTAQTFLQKFGPSYTKQNITSKLAQDFLSIWDDEDDYNEDGEGANSFPEIPSLDKVNNWIQATDFLDNDNSFSSLNDSQNQ